LKDATENPIMNIVGPACICDGPYACCCENKFTVKNRSINFCCFFNFLRQYLF